MEELGFRGYALRTLLPAMAKELGVSASGADVPVVCGIPDLHAHEESIFAEGDLVATRWTITGTHAGTMMGIPATGKPISIETMITQRIVDGKIVEDWFCFEELA